MPRMIDLVRVSALPSNLMHAASRGSLKVPPEEMIEILVHLANKNQIFGQQARMTLAAWDEASSKAAAATRKPPRKSWTTSLLLKICGLPCCPHYSRILLFVMERWLT